MFFLRKMSTSTFSAFKVDLFFDTIFPAKEKILSEETELAGMARYVLATWLTCGYVAALEAHQDKALSLPDFPWPP